MSRDRPAVEPAALAYGADGLLPVIVQEVSTGAVRMLGWANREAVERTLATGEVWFWSRSRRALWWKGETTGNVLRVVEVAADCDRDALLVRVDAVGPTCHTGARSCFEQPADGVPAPAPAPAGEAAPGPVTPSGAPRLELGWLWGVIDSRRGADPAASYTARLLAGGPARAAQKVGEEATEVVVAALTGPDPSDASDASDGAPPPLVAETADLLYHLLVLLAAAGADPEEVAAELARRHREASAGGAA